MSASALEMLMNPESFAHLHKIGEMYAASALIPPHLRGKLADVMTALTMAQEMNENPLVVMQNIYVVSGRAGWSSVYLIARANKSGIFRDRIDWRIEGSGDSLSVTCFATLASTGREVSTTVTMAMAKAEDWTKNSKYRTMPETMLRYRSAAALIRFYAYDVMLGYSTIEEVETLPPAEQGNVEVLRPKLAGETARKMIGEGPPAVDYVGLAEEADRKQAAIEAAATTVDGGAAPAPQPNPLATLPGPIADWLAELAEEVQTDPASIVGYLRSIDRDPAGLDDKKLTAAKLALGKDGGKRAALLEYIGRPSK